jgi:hypothetical protein
MAEDQLKDMLHALERRLVVVEHEREDAIPGPRVQLFVKQNIEPIEKAVQGIERAVERQSAQMELLGEKSEELYEAHKEFLKQEQVRKDAEAKAKTVPATLLRLGAYAGALGGIWTVFKIVGILIDGYLKARGFTP